MHGTLEITVVDARNLKKNKFVGKVNPYVTLRIEQTKQRTTARNQTNDPAFNEKFKFDIIDGQNTLFLEIFDDVTGSDTMIGVGTLELNQLFQKGMFDGWIQMNRQSTGEPSGQVRLVAYFRPVTGIGMSPPMPQQQAYSPQQQQQQQQPMYAPPPQQQQPMYGQQQGYAPPPQMYAPPPQQPMYAPPPQQQPIYAQPQPSYVYGPPPPQQQPMMYGQQPQVVVVHHQTPTPPPPMQYYTPPPQNQRFY